MPPAAPASRSAPDDGPGASADRAPAPTSSPVPAALDAAVREAGSVLGRLGSAAVNVRDRVWHGHLADTRRRPRTTVTGGRGWTLHRYEPLPDAPAGIGLPILLVPPLGAPDLAFDLRRGNSLVEFLLGEGRTVYIVTYDPAFWSGRRRGLETWIDDVVPTAVARVCDDEAGPGGEPRPVHIAGWSLGGLFVLLTPAAHPELPIASVTAFAAPVDVAAVPIVAPFRSIAEYTGGQIFTTLYRLLGGFPAPAVRAAFQLVSVDRYLTKPVTVLTHLDDRQLLEQMEAVDILMNNMVAYPGRAFGQVYHHVIRHNEVATDSVEIGDRPVHLADVTAPVLLIAGSDDGIAPVDAVRRGTELLTSSSDLRFSVEPGGHLGVLAGRRAHDHSWATFLDFVAAHDDEGR
ncbi:alpha/beta fold hydrolase [Actinomycetospora sp. TBRC 11914]|uniref:alpha/beta fold hydrolase n=1 Tax=Actinomycetospora sp. TBRC 11914 TaxID=2729387 RepID=UPI00145F761F|nr:alpha/beta fold hydrolase [Actinomycetospora sp. TBRC 11914]NMO90496.1 alpha/beta hydrolase [Actinomycetospora sp. TBRC 11914]